MHSDRLCAHWDTKSTLSPYKETRQKARDENKIGKVGMCLRQIPSARLFYFLASTLLFWAQQKDDLSLDWAQAPVLTEPIYSLDRLFVHKSMLWFDGGMSCQKRMRFIGSCSFSHLKTLFLHQNPRVQPNSNCIVRIFLLKCDIVVAYKSWQC